MEQVLDEGQAERMMIEGGRLPGSWWTEAGRSEHQDEQAGSGLRQRGSPIGDQPGMTFESLEWKRRTIKKRLGVEQKHKY